MRQNQVFSAKTSFPNPVKWICLPEPNQNISAVSSHKTQERTSSFNISTICRNINCQDLVCWCHQVSPICSFQIVWLKYVWGQFCFWFYTDRTEHNTWKWWLKRHTLYIVLLHIIGLARAMRATDRNIPEHHVEQNQHRLNDRIKNKTPQNISLKKKTRTQNGIQKTIIT